MSVVGSAKRVTSGHRSTSVRLSVSLSESFPKTGMLVVALLAAASAIGGAAKTMLTFELNQIGAACGNNSGLIRYSVAKFLPPRSHIQLCLAGRPPS
jgi:hypothetical protein